MAIKATATIADGDAEHLFGAMCIAKGLTADELASQLVADVLEWCATDPDVGRSLRDIRRVTSSIRPVR